MRRSGSDGLRRGSFAGVVAALAIALAGCAGGYTSPATDVTQTGATVKGLVFSTEDATVAYWFEYGPTRGYGSETNHRSLTIGDRNSHPVAATLTGLDAGTTYHYRVCAKDELPICGGDRTFSTGGGASELGISADPALYPDFDPQVSDYVTRCGGDPVTVDVSSPADTTVAIDGSAERNGTFSKDIPLKIGESFDIETASGGETSNYHVRCLPEDFPTWSWTSPGDPSASFYITTPQNVQTPTGAEARRYVAIFDDDGVPVWWMASDGASDAKLLPDDTLAWGRAGVASLTPDYEVHRIDGSLVKTWRTVGSDADIHDFQTLANGNVLIGTYPARPGTMDLSEYGGPAASGTPIDAEIQEIKPDGSVAWSWNAKEHIDLSETPERWRAIVYSVFERTLPDGRSGFDWAHMNSFQKIGNSVVVSFRHLDAVYGINMTTGDIIWKLGGTPTADSLTVLGDPESNPLGGQHYARVLANGDLTIHDNNSRETAPPRAIRYRIDLFNRTATLAESISDPEVPSSPCCGSAAKLPDGSWLMSWGGTENVTEFGPGGHRHFELSFTPNPGSNGFSYRVDPIVGDNPSIADFRAGMDAMP